MSLYFSAAVWTSLMLGGFGLVRHLVPRYRVRRPLVKATRRPIPDPDPLVVTDIASAPAGLRLPNNKSKCGVPEQIGSPARIRYRCRADSLRASLFGGPCR